MEKYIRSKQGTLIVESGRIDVLLGNLIIEFESDLDRKLEEAKEQLRKYIAILWSNQKYRRQWLAIASDGINFRVYRPRTSIPSEDHVTTENVVLEELDRCNLKNMQKKQGEEWIYVWLDRYLLYRTLIPPTTKEFVDDFGLLSKAFRFSDGILKSAWNKIKRTGVEAIYNEWEKYLEIVYGTKIESEDLFIRHTYLATLAKLMAFMFYSGSALPSLDEVEKIVSGDIFREWGIYGFLEEDFFSWILRKDIKEQGLEYIRDILSRLKRYDLAKLEEDVLKGLYQELVDPKERHDLGEYYTPDWLAETIVENSIKTNPNGSVLDPACGSGTFLVSTIKFKIKHLEGKFSPKDLLIHILSNVVGIDVHPLAVITSKVNFLLALGDLVRDFRFGRITIPVYMGDSIRLPKEVQTLEEKVVVYIVNGPEEKKFLIPKLVAENVEVHDEIIQIIREYVKVSEKQNRDTFKNFLKLRAKKFSSIIGEKKSLEEPIINSLFKTAETMVKLQSEGKDTIWAFILKNLFKPLFFFMRKEKFDSIIGNPPWLSYRYVKSIDYQRDLKSLIINRYRLLSSDKTELMTHMELATLFFLRVSDLYLKNRGKIGFVMPRSVFPADQHDNFRKGLFIHPKIGFTEIFDLLDVAPLFNVPSCVIFGRKGKEMKYPVSAKVISGKLPEKNCKLSETRRYLSERRSALNLGAIGNRSFLTEKIFKIPKKKSIYYKNVKQGATIVPRQLWFIEIISHPKFGVDQQMPKVRTSDRAIERAKADYKDLSVKGVVESRFLFAALTGSEVVPFGCLPSSPTILPIEARRTRYRLLESAEARTRGFLNLNKWLRRAEKEWEDRRKEKARSMTIYQRLNRQQGIISQNPKAKFKVIYNTSGTYLVSAVIKDKKQSINVNGIKFKLNGLVIDCTLYSYETDEENEAYYLSAILNSKIIDEAIKPAQARGLFGPRHIHKKPFLISIPKFNQKNLIHEELAQVGKKCSDEVKKILPKLSKQYDSIGWIRKKIDMHLKANIDHIDALVLKIFEDYGNKDTLAAFS